MSKPCSCKKCSASATKTTDSITASGFLTNEQLGPKQSITAEGFLLCEEVPIARIGPQMYAAIELPDLEDKDGVIEVARDADVVFSAETIASFTGKPVTIEHPPVLVTPLTWKDVAKGTTHNVRRGEGDKANLLLADLLITDQELIDLIVKKKLKEISCGYDAEYEQIAPGRARQSTIVGNHVAFVESARCGPVCSVQDSGKLIGETPMAAKLTKSVIADKLRKLFNTRDSEGLEKVLDELPDGAGGDDEKDTHVHIHMPGAAEAVKQAGTTDEEEMGGKGDGPVLEAIAKVAAAVEALGQRVSALESGKTTDSEVKDPEEKKTTDADETEPPEAKMTGDSASLVTEFQDAKSRAEILAPGIKFPTFDAKADKKVSVDALCSFRRRALTVALAGEHEDLVKVVTGDADVSKLTCDSARAFFNAASELVKRKNASVQTTQHNPQSQSVSSFQDINKKHADFWARKTN
ncbi:MAG: DUF2213 domain-containing protein [Herbaspirillum huttiense]|uniref:DUF2213 domain-containing protein n=1 Tax=Herbaspirillum huttiense TaxID=863372 RepID=UPI001ACCF7AB|nr:DUF2213 domain-containing protein [Herbaspirillum huttiense]MBN9359821.1 DUF2213 domain-containing protein [Herbaspirillum huttiense]